MRTFKSIFNDMSINQLKSEITLIKKGCGKEIDCNGYCSYISSRGNLILCSTCSRHLKIAKEVLELKTNKPKK